MDIFSLGCVFAEIWSDGKPLFDLSSLLKYKEGTFDPSSRLKKLVDDPKLSELIMHMIQLDPEKRDTASNYLKSHTGSCFPDYFKFTYQFLSALIHPSRSLPDSQVKAVVASLRFVLNEICSYRGHIPQALLMRTMKFLQPEEGRSNEGIPYSNYPSGSLRSRLEHHFIPLGSPSLINNTPTFELKSRHKVKASSIDVNATTNLDLETLHKIAVKKSEEGKISLDINLYKEQHGKQQDQFYVKELSEKKESPGIVLILNVVLSAIRNAVTLECRIACLELLEFFSGFLSSSIVLDRIVPYVMEIIQHDSSIPVVCRALHVLINLLESVHTVTTVDKHLFSTYILPGLSSISSKSELIRLEFSKICCRLGNCAKKFLDIETANATKELTDQKKISSMENDYFLRLEELRAAFVPLLEPFGKKCSPDMLTLQVAFLRNLKYPFLKFLGPSRVSEHILEMMTTCLNQNDSRLRAEFFEPFAVLLIYEGAEICRQVGLPFVEQGLFDENQNVVVKALQCFRAVAQIEEFTRADLLTIIQKVLPLLFHPFSYIRSNALAVVQVVAQRFGPVESFCSLNPLLQRYVRKELKGIDLPCITENLQYLTYLRDPIPLKLYNEVQRIVDESPNQEINRFKLKYANNALITDFIKYLQHVKSCRKKYVVKTAVDYNKTPENPIATRVPTVKPQLGTPNDGRLEILLELGSLKPMPLLGSLDSTRSNARFYPFVNKQKIEAGDRKDEAEDLVEQSIRDGHGHWKPRCVLTSQIEAHRGRITGIDVSSDSAFFVTGSTDGVVSVWDSSRLLRFQKMSPKLQFRSYSPVTAMCILERSHSIAWAATRVGITVSRIDYATKQDKRSFQTMGLKSGNEKAPPGTINGTGVSGSIVAQYQQGYKLTLNDICKINLPPSSGVQICSNIKHNQTQSESLLRFTTSNSVETFDLRAKEFGILSFDVDRKYGHITCFDIGPYEWMEWIGTSVGYIICWDLRKNKVQSVWRHMSHKPITLLKTTKARTFLAKTSPFSHPVSNPLLLLSVEGCDEVQAFDCISMENRETFRLSSHEHSTKLSEYLDSSSVVSGKSDKSGFNNFVEIPTNQLRNELHHKHEKERKDYFTSPFDSVLPNESSPVVSPEVKIDLDSADSSDASVVHHQQQPENFSRKKSHYTITDCEVSPSNFLITSSTDSTIRYWDLNNPRRSMNVFSLKSQYPGVHNQYLSRLTSSNCFLMEECVDEFFTDSGTAANITLPSGNQKKGIPRHRDVITHVKLIHKPTTLLLSCSRDGVINCWI